MNYYPLDGDRWIFKSWRQTKWILIHIGDWDLNSLEIDLVARQSQQN